MAFANSVTDEDSKKIYLTTTDSVEKVKCRPTVVRDYATRWLQSNETNGLIQPMWETGNEAENLKKIGLYHFKRANQYFLYAEWIKTIAKFSPYDPQQNTLSLALDSLRSSSLKNPKDKKFEITRKRIEEQTEQY